jgi:hypothetical protein
VKKNRSDKPGTAPRTIRIGKFQLINLCCGKNTTRLTCKRNVVSAFWKTNNKKHIWYCSLTSNSILKVLVASVGAVNSRGNTYKSSFAAYVYIQSTLKYHKDWNFEAAQNVAIGNLNVLNFGRLLRVALDAAASLNAHELQFDRFDWRFAFNDRQSAAIGNEVQTKPHRTTISCWRISLSK